MTIKMEMATTELYRYTISGCPATKKNSQQIKTAGMRKPIVRPSKAFSNYQAAALWELKAQQRGQKPINRPCIMTVLYYMPNRAHWPDLVGLMQATADILQKAEILEDDTYIVGWGETRIMGIDKIHPRAEIDIEVLPWKDPWYSLHPACLRNKRRGMYGV